MKYLELMEGIEPKLPGAPNGIKVMTPQQFLAKNEPEEKMDESDPSGLWAASRLDNSFIITAKTAEGITKKYRVRAQSKSVAIEKFKQHQSMAAILSIEEEKNKDTVTEDELADFLARGGKIQTFPYKKPRKSERMPGSRHIGGPGDKSWKSSRTGISSNPLATKPVVGAVKEATKLPAGSRPFGDEELTDYLDRIRNKEKKKTDKYKYPYIHRSSVVGYYDESGKKYNTDAIKSALTERPKALLKKNEKMKHSDGAEEQFFNIGFAALVGVAVDQETNELIIVNTCPGAGSCKVDCFAMKGGKIQFQGPWLSDGRILTFLLNDPEGFFTQLKNEITKEMVKGKKGGYKVSIRWHDAGDFFSPEYMDMAFKLASELPEVDFYAYTKVAKAALADKPKNFIINWSEGAAQSQEREIKSKDPELETTKNSRIVPTNLFYDLLVKDEKKNLVKGPEGQWQVIPNKLPELKQRLADEYGLSKNSILSYSEWENKGRKNPLMKWNVIITPGEPDLTAKDPGVLSTLLLKH